METRLWTSIVEENRVGIVLEQDGCVGEEVRRREEVWGVCEEL